MTSSGWSSLLLGTILATSAIGVAWSQTSEPAAVPAITAPTAAAVVGSPDMTVDPAVLAAAAIDAARAQDAVADEAVDRMMTGSIFAVEPGSITKGLTELRPRGDTGLREVPAVVDALRAPAAATAPKPANRIGDAAPALPSPAAPEIVPTPVAPTPVVPAAAPSPSSAIETPAAAETAEAKPATAPTEATVSTATPETPPAVTAAAQPVATAPSAPEPATASGKVAAIAPSAPVVAETPKPAVEAAAPVVATTAPAAVPAPPAVAVPAIAAPVVAAPSVPVTAPTTPVVAPVVTAPTVAPAPVVTAPVSTDAAIAATLATEKAAAALKVALEEMQPLAGASEDRADRAAILAFYAERAFLPLFVDAQGGTARALSVAAVLAHADRDGLENKDYALPQLAADMAVEARAKTEIAVARTVVRYARHLQTGRFDPQRVHELVTPKPPRTEARAVLTQVAGSRSVAETLEAYAPPHEGYRRLKAMLAELRGAPAEPPMVMLPVGPLLKPGQKDARVALLRERLGVSDVVSDAQTYDPSLAAAVKAFQRDRGLNPTGAVGRDTVAALNGEKSGVASRISDLISNMERWRWLPRDLGSFHVWVNTADYHLDVMRDGQSIHRARVIVGSPAHPTPVFSETMQYVVVNPYWNVPYSIVKNEMVGKAQASAGAALTRGNYEVEIGNRVVDPASVDWATVSPAAVSIRQRPGDGNALGNIKFMFPNQHSVYIHDTSSRGLFSQNFRALSHGCVRVHEPFSFADAVLSQEPSGLGGAQLKKMIGGREKEISLKVTVPVHITYFTAWVDDAGQLQSRPDVYGHDGRVKRLLGL